MRNYLHVYTGEGKGKTTAAFGLAVRALGHKKKVVIGQFLKNNDSGEIRMMTELSNAVVILPQPLQKYVFQMTGQERIQLFHCNERYALSLIEEIKKIQPSLVVLDELCPCLSQHVISVQMAGQIIDCALHFGETVVTGREAPEWLREKADYLMEIDCTRHPYNTNRLPAREGIEF